jgi:hypothetical protein
MDGLPKNVDLNTLIGREISMVSIGKFHVRFFLSEDRPKPDLWIEIESTDMIVSGRKISDFKSDADELCSLIGFKVEKAQRRDDGGLTLEFEGGAKLEVGIHTPQYESVVLHIGSDTIVG